MASKILYATKDSIVRDDSGTNRGSGKDPHNAAGVEAGGEERTLIDFEALPTITSLDWAKLWMFRSASHTGHDAPDNGAQLIPGRITADWSEGTVGADHQYSTANAVKWPGPSVTGELSARGSQPASGKWFVYVTEIVQAWIDGSAKKGIRLRGATGAWVLFDSVQGPNKPYLELSYGSNTPPDQPSQMSVSYGADGTSFTLTGHYFDQDGDTSTKFEVIFTPDQS